MASSDASPWLARLCAALPAFGLAASCSLRSNPEWPEVLREVRARYPTVGQLSIDALRTLEADPGPLLLDARAPEEFSVGHLRGAVQASDEEAALVQLAGSASGRQVVVYCSVGMRSSNLAERLAKRGFDAQNLEGGIFQWANAGLPVFRTAADGTEELTRAVHPFDARWGTLLAPEHHPVPGER